MSKPRNLAAASTYQRKLGRANRVARERVLDQAVPEGGIHPGTRLAHDPRGFGRYSWGDKRPARFLTVEVNQAVSGGGIIRDPATEFSKAFRAALQASPVAPVTIYDAAGKAIATMDPVTRYRKLVT